MRLSILIITLLLQFNLSSQELASKNSIAIGSTIEIKSSILKETREIYIYQPEGLWGMDNNLSNLPVIYVLDGESQFNHTSTTVDFLSTATNGNDFIPRSIVVGIPNTNRVRDLTPKEDEEFEMSGGGPQFLEFITSELIPYIDSTYHTSNHRTIIGHSLGGLLVFETLLRKREYFDNYIAIDPGFGFADESFLHEVMDSLDHCELSAENLYFTSANNRPMFLAKEDLMSDSSKFMKAIDIPNQKFIKEKDLKNWNINITTKHYPDENHYSLPHISTNNGLKELYHFYSFSEITNYYHPKYKNKNELIKKLKKHYSQISDELGYEVVPMQGYINSFAYGLSHFDRQDLTVELLEYNIELHPNDPIMYNNLGYFYMSQEENLKAIKMYQKSLELEKDEWVIATIEELKKKIEDNRR